MKSLIISNPQNNKFDNKIINLLDAGSMISDTCDVILLGYNLNTIASEVAKLSKVNHVFIIDSPHLENILAENIAPQLAEFIKSYTHVLVAADSFGKNLLPRIAGILRIGQISEIVKVISPNIFRKFNYAGNILVEVESLEDIKLLTVRTNSFDGKTSNLKAQLSTITNISYTENFHQGIKWATSQTVDKSVDLSTARVVVSGGISLASADNFNSHINLLANKLKAAVGATRAAVEAGYAPNDTQVGQTGKIVAPDIYIAVGLSGAVQHIAGMKDSKIVIAINIDQNAPIFEHADYGLIGDLFDIVPKLNQLINT